MTRGFVPPSILRELQSGPATVMDLHRRTGIHQRSIRAALHRLAKAGHVSRAGVRRCAGVQPALWALAHEETA